jgi:hypothetical protein
MATCLTAALISRPARSRALLSKIALAPVSVVSICTMLEEPSAAYAQAVRRFARARISRSRSSSRAASSSVMASLRNARAAPIIAFARPTAECTISRSCSWIVVASRIFFWVVDFVNAAMAPACERGRSDIPADTNQKVLSINRRCPSKPAANDARSDPNHHLKAAARKSGAPQHAVQKRRSCGSVRDW